MHGRDENNCRLLIARVLADELRQFKTIEFRHADVHQDDGDVGLQQVLQGFPTRTSLDQVLVQFTENHLITEQLGWLIIHHEDVDFLVLAHGMPPSLIHYRCSHMRRADRSCSVLTGLAR